MKEVKTYCSDCDNKTNHFVLYTKAAKSNFPKRQKKEIVDVTVRTTLSVVQCQGCDELSFLQTESLSDNLDEKDKPIVVQYNYPEPIVSGYDDPSVLQAKEIHALPPTVRSLYLEVVKALDENLSFLAGMGLRSLIEALCLHQNIPGKTLYHKIENLYTGGHIAKKDVAILHTLRDMGNDTVHEIKKPTQSTLLNALGIINHTLKAIYYLPRMESKIAKSPKSKRPSQNSIA